MRKVKSVGIRHIPTLFTIDFYFIFDEEEDAAAQPVLNRCERIENINNPIPRSNSPIKMGHRNEK
jgi:hypothetical protein